MRKRITMAAKKKTIATNDATAYEKPKKGKMTVAEAGRKGGMRTSETHGTDFYKTIGHKGGNRVKELIEAAKRAEK